MLGFPCQADSTQIRSSSMPNLLRAEQAASKEEQVRPGPSSTRTNPPPFWALASSLRRRSGAISTCRAKGWPRGRKVST